MSRKRSLNPHRPFLQDGCKNIIDESLHEHLTPTLSDRRQIERALNNRRTRSRNTIPPAISASSSRTPGSGTIPRATARLPPLSPAKSPISKTTARKTPRRLLDIAPDHETQVSFESDFNTSFATSVLAGSSPGAALGESGQDPASLLTTPAIDITSPDLDDGLSQPSGPSFVTSETGFSVPRMTSTHGTLDLEQIQDYINSLDLSFAWTMSPAELSQHLQDVNRVVEQHALPPPNPSSAQDRYLVEATCEGGYRFLTDLQFNDESEFNFIPQALVSKLICASEGPIGLAPVPPGVVRMARMPGGTLAALSHLLYVRLKYESPIIPFPATWVRFFVCRGTGSADDTGMVLGHEYTIMMRNLAASSGANHAH